MDIGWNRRQITFAGLLLILLIISIAAIFLLDLFYLKPFVGQMEWAAFREHAIKAEQAGQIEMRGHLDALSSLCSTWTETADFEFTREHGGRTEQLGSLIEKSLARGDVDVGWLTDPSGNVTQVWSKPVAGAAALVLPHGQLASLARDLDLPKVSTLRGLCKLGNRIGFFACAGVREKPEDPIPLGYLWVARILSGERMQKLETAVKGQVVFLDSNTLPKGIFFDEDGNPMVRLSPDGKMMLMWPVQDPAGRALGFFSCGLYGSQLQNYSQATRRSILIVSTLCFGLAILTVLGAHMMITGPFIRLLARLNRLLKDGYGTVEDLKEGLHGEALVLAGQVGLAVSRLAQTSRADPITGLSNRRDFEEVLDAFYCQASRYHRALSVILLDADNFKNINDKLGHPAGDRILRELAQAIVGALRGADRPARVGGDEFAVILPETRAEQAAEVAERIRRAVLSLEVPDLLGKNITVSIGVADMESGQITGPQDLIRLADESLYAVKARGRNGVHYARGPHGVCRAVAPVPEKAV